MIAGVFVIAAAGVSFLAPSALITAGISIWVILFLWVVFAALIKRLHDIGHRTLDVVYCYIPIVGFFIMLALMFIVGRDGINEFGPPRDFFAGPSA